MEVVKELFGTEDLYEVLAISKEGATNEKILRSAYLKAALKFHPDKAPAEEKDAYTKKFQLIKKIYDLFQDTDLKKIYDDTGSWPDDDKIELDVASFARLDVNAILEFKKLYQGSEEERQDIKKYYEKGEGDIFYICDNVFFLNVLDDEQRVNSIVEDLIEAGEVKLLTKGKKSAKTAERKKKKAEKEAKEAEQIMKEKNIGSLEDLQKAMARNQKARAGFLDGLAAKYGGGDSASASKRNGKKKAEAEPSDDEPTNKKSKISKPAGKSGGAAGGSRSTRSRSAKN